MNRIFLHCRILIQMRICFISTPSLSSSSLGFCDDQGICIYFLSSLSVMIKVYVSTAINPELHTTLVFLDLHRFGILSLSCEIKSFICSNFCNTVMEHLDIQTTAKRALEVFSLNFFKP